MTDAAQGPIIVKFFAKDRQCRLANGVLTLMLPEAEDVGRHVWPVTVEDSKTLHDVRVMIEWSHQQGLDPNLINVQGLSIRVDDQGRLWLHAVFVPDPYVRDHRRVRVHSIPNRADQDS